MKENDFGEINKSLKALQESEVEGMKDDAAEYWLSFSFDNEKGWTFAIKDPDGNTVFESQKCLGSFSLKDLGAISSIMAFKDGWIGLGIRKKEHVDALRRHLEMEEAGKESETGIPPEPEPNWIDEQIKLIRLGAKLQIYTPYHPDFPSRIKDIGGKWDVECWEVDIRDKERVISILKEIYGYKSKKLVTVELTLESEPGIQEYWEFGRKIVGRRFRDSDVTLGERVVIQEGSFPSRGGSRKYPRLGNKEPVKFLVRDVPIELVDESEDVKIVDG